jgi:hypothetical protein
MIPIRMLQPGIRHVKDNGDGFFSKSRYVVDRLDEKGVTSWLEHYDYETKEFHKDPHYVDFMSYEDYTFVHARRDENPKFNWKDPEYLKWIADLKERWKNKGY